MPLELPQNIREDLTKEFRIAADMMKEAPDLPSKLYVFSSFQGAISRAFNKSWHGELALLHFVLQTAHAAISNRLNAMMAGRDRPIQVPNEVSDRLTAVADKLATIVTVEHIDEVVLVDIAVELATLTYTTTGNGYYLYLKGDIKL